MDKKSNPYLNWKNPDPNLFTSARKEDSKIQAQAEVDSKNIELEENMDAIFDADEVEVERLRLRLDAMRQETDFNTIEQKDLTLQFRQVEMKEEFLESQGIQIEHESINTDGQSLASQYKVTLKNYE